MSHKFKSGQKAKIVNTGSKLDGRIVKIIGISSRHVGCTFYIILMDIPFEQYLDFGESTGITLIDSCLEFVPGSKVEDFEVGDRVYHVECGKGEVTKIFNGDVTVRFEDEDRTGVYDKEWFDTYPYSLIHETDEY